jgi:hypothetical protein
MYVGFDEDDLNCHFMALDPERVGLDNIEVPQICDFGDNVLDYMTRGGHSTEPVEEFEEEEEIEDEDEEVASSIDERADDSDASDNDSVCSEINVATSPENDYSGVLPLKFVDFLKS